MSATDDRLDRIEEKLDRVLETYGQRIAKLEANQDSCPARESMREGVQAGRLQAVGTAIVAIIALASLVVSLAGCRHVKWRNAGQQGEYKSILGATYMYTAEPIETAAETDARLDRERKEASAALDVATNEARAEIEIRQQQWITYLAIVLITVAVLAAIASALVSGWAKPLLTISLVCGLAVLALSVYAKLLSVVHTFWYIPVLAVVGVIVYQLREFSIKQWIEERY